MVPDCFRRRLLYPTEPQPQNCSDTILAEKIENFSLKIERLDGTILGLYTPILEILPSVSSTEFTEAFLNLYWGRLA